MKKVIITILVFMSCGFIYGYDDGDFQIWNTGTEEFKINDKLKFSLEQEFR